jgi:hypothetical protein
VKETRELGRTEARKEAGGKRLGRRGARPDGARRSSSGIARGGPAGSSGGAVRYWAQLNITNAKQRLEHAGGVINASVRLDGGGGRRAPHAPPAGVWYPRRTCTIARSRQFSASARAARAASVSPHAAAATAPAACEPPAAVIGGLAPRADPNGLLTAGQPVGDAASLRLLAGRPAARPHSPERRRIPGPAAGLSLLEKVVGMREAGRGERSEGMGGWDGRWPGGRHGGAIGCSGPSGTESIDSFHVTLRRHRL